MNSVTNVRAKRSIFTLILLAIFVALGSPFFVNGESLSKTFTESGEISKNCANASSMSTSEIPEAAVTRIGEVFYETLNDAFNASVDGETIWLLKDITLNPVYNGARGADFLGDKSITLRSDPATLTDGKTKHVISRGSNGNLINVGKSGDQDGTLIIADLAIDGKNMSSSATNFTHSLFGVYGTLIMEDNAEIYNANTFAGVSAVYVSSNGTFIMNGGSI